jgi:hypothetical protein
LLDVFIGGVKVLEDMLVVVREVEFLPRYINQPLFGDDGEYLAMQGHYLLVK